MLNAPPMIVYRYSRKKMLPMLLAFNLIPVIVTGIWVFIALGLLKTSSVPQFALLSAACLCLYAFFLIMFIRMFRDRELMTIYRDGRFRYFPVIRLLEKTLPSGSRVDFNDRRVVITSDLDRISSFKSKNGVITIPLPAGLEPAGSGNFEITRRESDAR